MESFRPSKPRVDEDSRGKCHIGSSHNCLFAERRVEMRIHALDFCQHLLLELFRSDRFIEWDELRKLAAELRIGITFGLAKTRSKLLPLLGKTAHSQMASSPYFALAVLFVAALGFGLAPLGLAWLWQRVFSPAKPNEVKNAIYECGLESKGDAWVQFRSAYYLYAIIFLIFDVEAVFLLPFAVAFTGLSVAACISMVIFVLLLIEGLAWAWVKGVLTWA